MDEKSNPFEFFRLDGIEIVKIKEHVLSFEKHTHTADFTCSVITEGTAVFTYEGKTVILGESGCFTVLPNYPHSLTSEKPVSMISLCINTELIYEFKSNPSGYGERIRAALSRAAVDTETSDILYGAANDIYELYRITDSFRKKAENAEKALYYSKYHYIRKFSKSLGLTPHKYRLQCRIREAQKLLMNGFSSADAAAQEDFYDESHFIKSFKTVVGVTPFEYKASLRNFLQYK